jgi:hypothetical protein
MNMTEYRYLNARFIGLVIILLIAAIGGLAIMQSKIAFMQTKVEQAMSIDLENLAPQWPRIEVHSDLATQTYYAPLVNQVQEFQLYRHVLEYLNQDTSVPPLKVSQISAQIEYGAAEDTLMSQARVEFPLVLGIEQELTVQSAIKIPHYQTLN